MSSCVYTHSFVDIGLLFQNYYKDSAQPKKLNIPRNLFLNISKLAITGASVGQQPKECHSSILNEADS